MTPYSVRHREKAPISTPLKWSEVKPGLDPADFNLGNFAARARHADPWEDFYDARQPMKDATARVRKL